MGKIKLFLGAVTVIVLAFESALGVSYEIEAQNQDLIYVSDFSKGISPNRDPKRFATLKIPPSSNVIWFSPDKRTHIQAIAFDGNFKKQYFYHPSWEPIRNKIKNDRLKSFGEILPYLRRQVRKENSYPGFIRVRALSAVVMLLDQTAIPVFELTNMTRKNLKFEDGKYYLAFKDKSGKHHRVEVKGERLNSYLQESLRQPGEHLFKYIDEDRNMRFVVSSSVNEYLKKVSGLDISERDFRSWMGTVLVAEYLFAAENKNDEKINKKANQFAADKLGNAGDIHPQIFLAFMEGKPFNKAFQEAEGDSEAAVIKILSGVKEDDEK